MEIKQAQAEVDSWIKTIGVRYFNELTNMAILMEEVGELARVCARLYGEQSFKNELDAKTVNEKWEEELADILFVLICLANQTGVDLETAIKKSLEKKTKRDFNRHQENEKLSK